MRQSSIRVVAPLALCVLAAATTPAHAGSLTPPAGPVTPTMKTLDQVEPRTPINSTTTPGNSAATFRITQPGSYYLTGNVTGQPARHGISIESDNVTLDLMGFALLGGAGTFDGINIATFRDNIVIRNGHVRNWGGDGIDAQIDSGRIEQITSVNNGGRGITNLASTLTTTIRACEVRMSGSDGILAGADATISDCTVRMPGGAGIVAGDNAVIERCTVHESTNDGIRVGRNAALNTCAVRAAGGLAAFSIGPSATLTNCAAADAAAAGFLVAQGAALAHCAARDNSGPGFSLDDGAAVSACVASGNLAGGFVLDLGGTISDSTAINNSGDGITAATACTIRHCAALRNTGDEIQVFEDCLVVGNTCKGVSSTALSGHGIRVFGANNRIESNNCIDNDRGISVEAAGNFIARNTAASNIANYNIVAGNAFGPLINAAAAGDLAAVAGADHPFANFQY